MNSNTYLPFLLETRRGTRLNYNFQKSAAGSRARSENPFDPLMPLRFSDTPQLQIIREYLELAKQMEQIQL